MLNFHYSSVAAAIIGAICIVASVGSVAEQPPSETDDLASIQNWFGEVVTREMAAYDALNINYVAALKRIAEEESKAANLDGVVQVKKEIDVFGDGVLYDEGKFKERISKLPALRIAQNTYLTERARITASIKAPMTAALREYDKRLEGLQNRLTRSQLIDEALAVSELREKVRLNPQAAVAQAREVAANQLVQVLGTGAGALRFTGRLMLVMRGEAKIFHNGEPLRFRNVSSVDTHVAGKTDVRVFKPGDFVVVQAQSSLVARHLVVAICSEHDEKEIPIKIADWRILGVDLEPSKVTAEQIRDCATRISNIPVNEPSEKERQALKFRPADQGGSDWVHLPNRGWHTVGFLVTEEMLTRK